jgi:hypothetical protein
MSSTNREGSTNPEHDLTPSEVDDLDRLEAVAQRGLGTYLQVGNALAEIRDRHLYRDSHPSFEAYVRERWGVGGDASPQTAIRADTHATPTAELEPRAALPSKPCEALARACEETLSALSGDGGTGVEIRLAVLRHGPQGTPAVGPSLHPLEVADPSGDELLPALRWLLAQASGTIGEVGHQLETRAADIDDRARAQLRDDVLVVDGELAVVKALLLEVIDWDSELGRLLGDELPPPDADAESEDDD